MQQIGNSDEFSGKEMMATGFISHFTGLGLFEENTGLIPIRHPVKTGMNAFDIAMSGFVLDNCGLGKMNPYFWILYVFFPDS